MQLTSLFTSSKQKINSKIQVLNDTLDQINVIDIYRTIHLKTTEYKFFSSAYGIFSRIDHILGHKSSLNKFMKVEFISNNFSDHNAEIRYQLQKKTKKQKNKQKKPAKNTSTWKLSTMLLSNQWVTVEIKGRIAKISTEKWQGKHDNTKPIGGSKYSSKREVYSNTISSQETRNISNNLSSHTKQLEKEKGTKLKVERKKS